MSDEPKYRDEEWLREQYVEKRRSSVDIADECECDCSTVRNWMERHGIEARSPGSPVADRRLTDEEWLRKQYVENGRTTYEIAEECGCRDGTVGNWLSKHGIQRRDPTSAADKRLTDEEWLCEQYWEKEKSVADIADECGCAGATVHSWMERHGINRRTASPDVPDERLTDEEWLRGQYWEKEKSTVDIANECGCVDGTVGGWMEHHGIEARSVSDAALSGVENPNWEGGRVKYGPGWTLSKRRQVRERDGYECADCGTTQTEHKAEYDQKLHVHHLIKARDIDDPEERNAPENLITLCRDCHQRWERLSEAGIRPQIDGVTAD